MQASEPAQRNQPLKASTRLRRSESLGLLMALTVVIQLPATRVLVLIVKDNLDQPEFIALQEEVPDKPHIIPIPNRLTHIINQEAPVEATVNRLASHSSWTRPWNSVAQLAAESMPYWMNFPHQLPRTMTTRSRLQQTSSFNNLQHYRAYACAWRKCRLPTITTAESDILDVILRWKYKCSQWWPTRSESAPRSHKALLQLTGSGKEK